MLPVGIARIIASRYLLSKKSHSVINMISMITIIAITVPTAAMIIMLSVHNGFGEFIGKLWGRVDAQLVIEPVEGKYFNPADIQIERIKNIEGIKGVCYYIEDNALLRYKERQSVAIVKGVDDNYGKITGIESVVLQGKYNLEEGALVGMGVAYTLGLKVNLSEGFEAVAPSPISYDPFNPSSIYNIIKIPLAGVFSLDAERDSEIIYIALNDAQRLFSRKNEITAIALDCDEVSIVKGVVADMVGDKFSVKDIYEQNEDEYRLIESEKAAVYLIILLVIIIASFTLVGAVIMLIIEKKESMFVLRAIGLTTVDIRRIFVWQGAFISAVGAVLGITIGVLVAFAQQKWGFVPINGASLLLDSYPVKVMFSDTILVLLSVIAVTFTISIITNRIMIKN